MLHLACVRFLLFSLSIYNIRNRLQENELSLINYNRFARCCAKIRSQSIPYRFIILNARIVTKLHARVPNVPRYAAKFRVICRHYWSRTPKWYIYYSSRLHFEKDMRTAVCMYTIRHKMNVRLVARSRSPRRRARPTVADRRRARRRLPYPADRRRRAHSAAARHPPTLATHRPLRSPMNTPNSKYT